MDIFITGRSWAVSLGQVSLAIELDAAPFPHSEVNTDVSSTDIESVIEDGIMVVSIGGAHGVIIILGDKSNDILGGASTLASQ